ncbi:MAG: SusC/RagA family TonB-linked outer membrane protein [Ferruginibacter sp.]|nr:SusC/RagA family TonB-linked outer membrane protein [Chitinophagaceae bacterium]
MKRLLLLLALMITIFSNAIAQREVTGRVTDARDGSALPAASIRVKGKNTGTSTGDDGRFRIQAGPGETLVVSSIGFIEKEVNASDAVIDISLQFADQTGLREVVVTGYTVQSRREVTASIGKVSGADVKFQPVASFDQLLQGKTPGVLIQSQSGQPGAPASNITIRGKGSVLASTQPLFIVDGIQVTGADFQSINPADIETYTILKDAVATSQYGSRGANGVIVVTTRRGTNAKTKITYDYQYGTGQLPKNKLRLMNSAEKIDFETNYDHPYGMNFYGWTPAEADSLSKVNANWEKIMFRKANTQQHVLSAVGGNDKTRFFISGSVFDQEGTVQATALRRYTGRLNIDHTVDNLKIGLSTFVGSSKLTNTNENDQFIGSPLNAIRWANPYVTAYLPDGSFNELDLILQGQPNALKELLLSPATNNQLKGLAAVNLEYKFSFLKGLSAKTNWGVDYTNDDNTRYIDRTTYLGSQQVGTQGSFAHATTRRVRYTGTSSLSYGKQAGDHNFRVSLFNEYVDRRTTTFGYTGFGLIGLFGNGGDITPGTPANGYIPVVADGFTEQSLLSWFAIGDYSFKNKYFVNGSLRRDGSSRLAEGNKWVNYGGIGIGWLISAENFMQNSKVFSELKLKASYGSAGNENVGNSYESRELLGVISYNGKGGLVVTNFEKPDLSWEVRKTANIGIDFGLFNDRITGAVDVYSAATKGLYLNRQLSGTNGVNSILTNLGKLRNRGIEVAVNADIIKTTHFNWQLGFNHTINQSEVIALDGTDENIIGFNINRLGERLNSIYLVRYAGVDPANGDALYYKADGKTTTNVYDPNDKAIVGTFDPPHFGAFNTLVNYRGIEFSAQFTYMFGHKIFNNDRQNVENPAYVISNISADLLQEWQNPGDITAIPSPFNDFQAATTRFLEDGKFIRLRNVVLSYQVPAALLNRVKISGLRFYVQGQNLYTWHQFKGYDPEVATGTLGGSQYPLLKTITVGVSLGL